MIELTTLVLLAYAAATVPKNPPCLNGWVDRVALLCPGQEPAPQDIWPKQPRKAKRKS